MTLSQDVEDGLGMMMIWMVTGRVIRVISEESFHSRKRGFTKKRRKERREQRDAAQQVLTKSLELNKVYLMTKISISTQSKAIRSLLNLILNIPLIARLTPLYFHQT